MCNDFLALTWHASTRFAPPAEPGGPPARFGADTLLGVASVPLSALLQEAWVDGYAPVLALMTRAGDGALAGAEERVQVRGRYERPLICTCCASRRCFVFAGVCLRNPG
jgi:hypothetical protein